MWEMYDLASAGLAPAILTTKLRPPRPTRDLVSRRRLAHRLLDGLDRPLTLVVAPAGFGKTTLLAAALADYDGPWGWLTLDADDNDLGAFMEHLVAAIQSAMPNVGLSTLSLLRQSRDPAPNLLARTLANELAVSPHGALLVLDDYDAIRQPVIHAVVDLLLRHPTSGLRLIILARSRPGLSLGRLRAHGQLLEIDADDLRFTRSETEQFLAKSVRGDPSPSVIDELHRRTEGWIAGLRLLSLAPGSAWETPALTDIAHNADLAGVRAFLMEEVLAKLPPSINDALIRLAPFERICAGLADAVRIPGVDGVDGQTLVRLVAREELFIVALDSQGMWHRFHSLFRECLHQEFAERLSIAERAAIHLSAANWFAAQGLIEDALQHALRAGEADIAAEIVERHVSKALATEEWPRIERWLHQLPIDVVERRPALLMARAWIFQLRWRLGDIPDLLDRAEALLARIDPGGLGGAWRTIRGQIATMRGLAAVSLGNMTFGFEAAETGWRNTDSADQYQRGVAIFVLAMAAHALGHGDRLADLIRGDPARDEDHAAVYAARVQFGFVYCDLADGALFQLERSLASIQRLSEEYDQALSDAWVRYALGLLHYEWDDLTNAERHFRAVIERRHRAHILPLQGSQFGLALTLQAQGRPDLAETEMRGLLESAFGSWSPALVDMARSFRARLALREGDVELASRWLPAASAQPSFSPAFNFEVPELTLAWLRIARENESSLIEAAEQLSLLERAFASWRETRRLIQILALKALAADGLGERARAVTELERAIELAAPGRHIRTFVDFGSPMARLLDRLSAPPASEEYVHRLRVAFRVHATAAPARICPNVALVEGLTGRELEVLKLLEQRLTDREIASDLHISWQTVATHTRNIYQKLQVSGRREAVAVAREIGLLES
jgi:ATP/maltotriose-dependent transcriptional regulator MalT